MGRRLFCEISPLTYKISVFKGITLRKAKDFIAVICGTRFAREKTEEKLPIVIYRHKSLIRRRLGNADMRLQENKAVNLSIAAPCISGILIKPGETFSFWQLVGNPSEKRGFLEGLTIERGKPSSGIGGGMCQLSNLIHWMALHSDLDIAEHHHHDGVDLFRDYGRQVPFGTGTSVMYNYLDYRLKNNTDNTFQLVIYSDGEYLCGELRAEKRSDKSFHVKAENEKFVRDGDDVYRTGQVYRRGYDARTGKLLESRVIRENYAKVMYDTEGLTIEEKVYNDTIINNDMEEKL